VPGAATGRLLVVVVGVVILVGAAYATWTIHQEKVAHFERAAALRDDLQAMREGIQHFHADHQRYPRTLQELVPRYIRRIPHDPVTGASDWRLETEQTVAPNADFTATTATPKTETYIIDVHSAASGLDANGKPFADY
jgi:general secretion pathway protein G